MSAIDPAMCGGAVPDGRAALAEAVAAIGSAGGGIAARTVLAERACGLSGAIAEGLLDRQEVETILLDAASRAGLDSALARIEVHSGLANGDDHTRAGAGLGTYRHGGHEDKYPPGTDGPDMSVIEISITPAPALPLEAFGPLGSWLAETATAAGAPIDYVAGALLAAVAGAVGACRRVNAGGAWSEPVILWIALIGSPSSGKSPALDPILSAIGTVEAEWAGDFGARLRKHEADKLAAKHLRDAWELEVKAAVEQDRDPPPLPDNACAPPTPSRPRLRIADATYEALAEVLAQQPRGVLLLRDELAGWLTNLDRYGGNDRGFYLECYGGRSYVVDRKKLDEPLNLPFAAVSMLGGIQPDRLHDLLLTGSDDGLFSRFLPIWPEPVPPARPADVAQRATVEHMLRRLRQLDFFRDDNQLRPVILPLEPTAADAFHAWRMEHYAATRQAVGLAAGAYGKMPGQALRLAGTLEFAWWAAGEELAEPTAISSRAMGYALHLVEAYLKPMLLRALGEAARPKIECDAAILGREILERRCETVNTRDIQRRWRLPSLKTAAEINAALTELSDARWVRPVGGRDGDTKGRQRSDFLVNPRVWEHLP